MSPKAKKPLGSAKATKSIAGEYDPELGYSPKVLTFYDRGGKQKVRLYNKPLKPPTPEQRAQRNIIKDKVAAWQALSPQEKAPWNSEAKALGDPWSGYTLFMSTFIGEEDMSHDLFSETHPDTVPAVPVSGDIILANATPKWTKLAKDAEGKVLKMGAALPEWADPGRVYHLPSDEHLAAYFPFDEGAGLLAVDASGNGNNGTLINLPAEPWVNALVGKCINFPATNSYVDCGDAVNISAPYSISAWIKMPSSSIVTLKDLVTLGPTVGVKPRFSPQYRNTHKPLLFLNPLCYKYGSSDLGDDLSHHIIFIVTGDGIDDINDAKIYVDAIEEEYSAVVSTDLPLPPTGHAFIGSNYFDGLIDEVRIYDRALTPNEVKALYLYPSGYKGTKISGQQLVINSIRHLIIDPARFKMPAANFPAESFEGLFYTLDFDKNTEQSAYCQEHVPYRWDPSTDIEIVVSWLYDGDDAGKVVWGIEYKAINAGEPVIGSGTTITQATAGNHSAGLEVRTTFAAKILHANLEHDDDLAIRFFRKAADGNDTLAEDARAINVHLHFTQNALGKTI